MKIDIQNIFNRVIDSGAYCETKRPSMCRALAYAAGSGSISLAEHIYAKAAIEEYLGEFVFLSGALEDSGLPYKFKNRLAIFQNWGSRPELKNDKY